MDIQSEKQAIEKMLFSYRDALNASDVSQSLSHYVEDGIFMPTNAPSAVGLEQLKDSYEHIFNAIQLHVEFFIHEIVISGDYAFVRTSSKGTQLTYATKQTVPEENRELFVLQMVDQQWKIAQYMFNKTK